MHSGFGILDSGLKRHAFWIDFDKLSPGWIENRRPMHSGFGILDSGLKTNAFWIRDLGQAFAGEDNGDMTYKRFEDVPVWQDAASLARDVFDLVEDDAFHMRGDMASQMARAGLSVSNNIAEGFGRGTTKEVITFLYTAQASADEVRSMLAVAGGMKRFDHIQPQISDLQSRCESISRQLTSWAMSLQSSDVKGRRYYVPK